MTDHISKAIQEGRQVLARRAIKDQIHSQGNLRESVRPCERFLRLPEAREWLKPTERWISVVDCVEIILDYCFGVLLGFPEPEGHYFELFNWQGPTTAGFVEVEWFVGHPGRYLHAHWGVSFPTVTSQIWVERVRELHAVGALMGDVVDGIASYNGNVTTEHAHTVLDDYIHPELALIQQYLSSRTQNHVWTGSYPSQKESL